MYEQGRVEIIGSIPSYVAFTDKDVVIGADAKEMAVAKPSSNTVFGAKRLIGLAYDDPGVQSLNAKSPFRIINRYGKPMVEVQHQGASKGFTPEEFSSLILGKVKNLAESHFGSPVSDVVLTVPAYFNEQQRQATIDAGVMAGFSVLGLIDEPTAAVLAYGLEHQQAGRRHIMVFDLGGGSFDVSVLATEGGKIEVLSKVSDSHLGGEDFDNRLVEYFAAEFRRKNSDKDTDRDLATSKQSMLRLRTACERAKKALSSAPQANIQIDSLFQGIDFYSSITRSRFEELCEDLFQTVLDPVKEALGGAKLDKKRVYEIILVGRSTAIPRILRDLYDYFDEKDLLYSIDPEVVVAHGAAIQAHRLCARKTSQPPPSEAVLTQPDQAQADKAETTPQKLAADVEGALKERKVKEMGNAMQQATATQTGGDKTGPTIIRQPDQQQQQQQQQQNTVPLSVGLETAGGAMTALIKRDSHLPTKGVHTFTTFEDNQSSVEIKIFEGERALVRDNNLLGTITLGGIPPAPRGTPHIKVTFDIDRTGKLNVTAVDQGSGKSETLVIPNIKERVSQSEIDRHITEAKQYESEDQKHRDRIACRNALASFCAHLESFVASAQNLSQDDRNSVTQKINSTRDWAQANGATAEPSEFECRRQDLQSESAAVVDKATSQKEQQAKPLSEGPNATTAPSVRKVD